MARLSSSGDDSNLGVNTLLSPTPRVYAEHMLIVAHDEYRRRLLVTRVLVQEERSRCRGNDQQFVLEFMEEN